jgi:AraC family transcriptional regulator, dual regulator of chb operon
MSKQISWNSITESTHTFYVGRYRFAAAKRFAAHTHDFAEITLIESGDGKQIINGTDYTLKPGDLFFIRPADRHSIEAGPNGLGVANFAFRAEHAVEIEQRYLPNHFQCFRSTADEPLSIHLDADSFAQAVLLYRTLAGATRDVLELDRALLNFFAILRKPFGDLPLVRAPDWLRCACAEMQRPAHLAEGVQALFRFAGRSKEHTARELRRHSGCTPTQFVRHLRLNHAAQLLCTTDKSVLDIALECGFDSQGHFHTGFKERFYTTPLKYRKQNRAPML